ncbi:hypothetical protein [Allonocardiopsis opalescens]|uniref:Para-aminobenzoate N-oxygenase AurF n=1 Tax=Allonocardiopsis opalescens TaxID=1144618 RepID=A0A2T0PSL1_9ACTN|nr:hypothetical protein [Allonocardiopsis opalescens]PRX91726.1 hypothetical protein CLV72_1148 [Allonocardiopsis opalescens]
MTPRPGGGGAASGRVDLAGLGFTDGADLLVRRALAGLPPGGRLHVSGRHPELRVHLGAWCRGAGHRLEDPEPDPGGSGAPPSDAAVAVVVKGRRDDDRWFGAVRAGSAHGVVDRPPGSWGLAARGALIEAGGPEVHFDVNEREVVWADAVARMYAHAASRQWDPATAVDWSSAAGLDPEIETAVVQLMTYLVENEQAALIVPARFLGRIHPHFREVVQLLSVQVADEARHMEVFNRRALLHRDRLGTSSAGGRASLLTLVEETDFSMASFLLSVLGEGSFVDLLAFLHTYAPDPVTRRIAWLAMQDERRHVAFGVAHLQRQAEQDPALLGRLRGAIERRHDALADTAGLNDDVFASLVVLAAGEWTPAAIAAGGERVRRLQHAMDDGRRRRLVRLGFPLDEAAELSALHTRNFM